MKTAHLTITGRVQGVGYRGWTQREATRLGLTGWVRNCQDGSVEARVSGPKETVERLISACRYGPPAAEVTNIQVRENELAITEHFEVLASV